MKKKLIVFGVIGALVTVAVIAQPYPLLLQMTTAMERALVAMGGATQITASDTYSLQLRLTTAAEGLADTLEADPVVFGNLAAATLVGDGSGLYNVTAKIVPIYNDEILLVSGVVGADPFESYQLIDGTYSIGSPEPGDPNLPTIYFHEDGGQYISLEDDVWWFYHYDTTDTFRTWSNTNASPWLGDWVINFGPGGDAAQGNPGAAKITVTDAEEFLLGDYVWQEGGKWVNPLSEIADETAEIYMSANGFVGWVMIHIDDSGTEPVSTLYYANTNVTVVSFPSEYVGWPWIGAWSADELVDEGGVLAGALTPTVALAFDDVPTVIRDYGTGYDVQSPWFRDINAAGFSLTNLSALQLTNGITMGSQAGIDATVNTIVAGNTTNRLVFVGGILVSNIAEYWPE